MLQNIVKFLGFLLYCGDVRCVFLHVFKISVERKIHGHIVSCGLRLHKGSSMVKVRGSLIYLPFLYPILFHSFLCKFWSFQSK